MGRAIDMEKDIDTLKMKVAELENIVRGMTHTMSQTEHIDLVDDVKKGEDNAKEKETNDEGNGKGNGKSNKRKTTSVSKTSKS